MKTPDVEQQKVGLMLACGFTRKEIAAKTGKSVNTVMKQTDSIYKKTGSRNLADITRHMISRYSGFPSEDILINALHDLTVGLAVAFIIWVAAQPEIIEEVNSVVTSLINAIR